MKPGTELTAIHPAVEAGVKNQDIDGLMALYAEDASMVLADGSIVTRSADHSSRIAGNPPPCHLSVWGSFSGRQPAALLSGTDERG